MIPSFMGNKFLKPDDVKNGDIITFIDEGVEVDSKFRFPELKQDGTPHPMAGQIKKEFRMTVEIGFGEQRTLRVNMTSFRQLSDKWSTDTVNWMGKKAKVTLIPLPTGRKMISLEAVDG